MRTRTVLVLIGVVLVMSSGLFAWAGDDLPALEKETWQAWKDNDDARFLSYLTDDYVGVDRDGITVGKKALQEALKESPCDVKSFKLGKITVHPMGDDMAILTFEAHIDATCNGQTRPPHVYSSSFWVKQGGKWLNACYTEVVAKE